MAVEQGSNITQIPTGILKLRYLTRFAISLPFRRTLTPESQNGLHRLNEFAAEGYGSLVFLNHFSRGDFMRVLGSVLGSPVLIEREAVIPIAIHQNRAWFYRFAGFNRVTLCPIVTEDTKKFIRDHPEKGTRYEEAAERKNTSKLMQEYLKKGLEVLKTGGVVLMTPQGARRPYLDNISNAGGLFLERADEEEIKNIAVTFVGVGIPREVDYGRKGIDGYQLFTPFGLNIGETLTATEIQERANGRASNTSKAIDMVIIDGLRAVVPSFYLPR